MDKRTLDFERVYVRNWIDRLFVLLAAAAVVLIASALIFAPQVKGADAAAPSTVPAMRGDPPVPRAHNKEFWLLVAANKVMVAADIESTQALFRAKPTTYEMNPLLPRRPGRGRMYAQLMAESLVFDYVAWRLRRAGHPTVARVLQCGTIGVSIWCVQHNWRVKNR